MKKLLPLLSLIFFVKLSSAQIIISEIMYNPPESGTDSLEYLELYNTTDTDIDLTGYSFSSGIEHTFEEGIIASNGYFLLAVNAVAFESVYDIPVEQWDGGALQNGGELIELADANDNIIFSIRYDDADGWPTDIDGTDGEGASIELCDLTADPSNPFNWNSSATNTGFTVNSKDIYGTPGNMNSAECREDMEETYMPLTIVEVEEVDTDGVSVFINQLVELNGIAHGTNTNPNGLQFAILDQDNNGVWVYNQDNNLGYQVKEGDELQIFGRMTQFNGLLQIIPDSLVVTGEDNDLVSPSDVDVMNEATEGSLIRITNLMIVDSTEWRTDGSSFNFRVSDGTNEYNIRINENTNIAGLGIPEGLKSITGLGGQFDSNSPFDEGYQLLPRYEVDIEADNFATEPEITYDQVSISDINGEENNGTASSIERLVEVTAVTYGFNYRPNGLQFTIIDENNNGIGIFSGVNSFGYDFKTGDEITVWGEVDQFAGLTQIRLDSLILVSEDNMLIDPLQITTLDESTESTLIEFVGVSYPEPNQWLGDGSSFNVDISDGNNTITMRIDSDSPFSTMEAPDPASFIMGIGGQFDNSEPFDEGYQFFPISFSPYLSVENIFEDDAIKIFPNPTMDFIKIDSDINFDHFEVFNLNGQLVLKAFENKINLSGLDSGNYILVAKNDTQIARSLFEKI